MTHRGIITSISTAILALALASSPSLATYRDLIGYPELETALGSSVPTGDGVLVTHVEALFEGDYLPNPGYSEFSGKTFIDGTSGSTGYSAHARQVGTNFYGNTISIAPDISNITVFEAGDWMESGFLRKDTSYTPYTSTSRIATHNWVYHYASSSSNINVLRRLDFVVETDDYIQVIGIDNIPPIPGGPWPLLGDSYNAIAVGRTDANHFKGTTSLDSIYVSGRTKPDLVAPGHSPGDSSVRTSWGAPMVAAAAALLVETGHDNPGLSNGSYSSPRTAATIYHAETSEVIKAALMAGADRNIDNIRGADITDYAVDTDNGLDSRFGAGQVNIFNSYNIINGGEHDSFEDGDATDIGQYGFDYDPAFGGASGSNSTASYFFDAAAGENLLITSLAWNLDVSSNFNTLPTFRDLDLLLYDVTSGSLLIGSSDDDDNTENMYQQLTVGHSYKLEVSPKAGQGDFLWDYGLAWQLASTTLVPGDANLDGMVDGLDMNIVGANWQQSPRDWSQGNFNTDTIVDGLDMNILGSNWQLGVTPPPEPPGTTPTIPEPATLWLMILAGAVLAKRNKKQ